MYEGVRGCFMIENARATQDPNVRQATSLYRDKMYESIVSQLEKLGASNAAEMADAVLVSLIGISGAARDGMSQKRLESPTEN